MTKKEKYGVDGGFKVQDEFRKKTNQEIEELHKKPSVA